MIRAYVPWYLVRNYLMFAFVACLGALQLAAACSGATQRRRARYAAAIVVLVGAFLGFYALAPDLLTPGPAGGELTFLLAGAALLAILVTHILFPRQVLSAAREYAIRRGRATQRTPMTLEIQYLILALCSLAVVLLDRPLFHALNGLAFRTPLIDAPVQFLMNDYIVPTALVLALLTLWFAGRDVDERACFQRVVLRALLALALASVTLKLINEVYFRPRPFTFDDNVRLLFYHPSDSSMPSNAATVCFALAVSVWQRQKRWGAAMLALAVGMTLARVVGGVHYPADIVVGAWLGGVSAWLVNRAIWLDRPLDAVAGLARQLGLG